MKKLFYSFILGVLIFCLGCINKADNLYNKEQIIWFKKAADLWEEALPIGNGRLGAMVYGNTKNEKIQLNDDSLCLLEVTIIMFVIAHHVVHFIVL